MSNYKGIAFPFRFPAGETGTGRQLAMVSDEENIRQSIIMILRTSKNERIMREDFGCRLNEFVFSQQNSTTKTLIRYEVLDAISRFEPRVEVVNVGVEFGKSTSETIEVNIEYRLRESGVLGNLTYMLNV